MKKLLLMCLVALFGVACTQEESCEPKQALTEEEQLILDVEKELDFIFDTREDYQEDQVKPLLCGTLWCSQIKVKYDDAWGEILRVLNFSYKGEMDGNAISLYRYNWDNTFVCETISSTDVGSVVETGTWSYDATSRSLVLTYVRDNGTSYTVNYRLQILDEISLIWDYTNSQGSYREVYMGV